MPGSPSAANEGGKEDAFERAMGGDSQPGTSSGHEKGAASRGSPSCPTIRAWRHGSSSGQEVEALSGCLGDVRATELETR